jgi:hypothetical protein
MIPDSLQLSLGVAETMTIDALGASGVLNVGAGVEGFSLRGLTLSGGMADLGSGLLVGSASRVTLANVNVTDYLATGNAVSGMFDSNGLFTASINDLFNPTHTLVLVTGSR